MIEKPKFEITSPTGADVPAFTCIVYVSRADGNVSARVANLDGIQATAASEREVLAKVIPEFKKRVSELHSGGTEIPWIDPPKSPLEGEQKRIVPVHL
jgi:hypothetical protein